MRKSTYKFVAGLFAIALLAAGCSSSSDSASEETAATEESAAPAAADPELEIFTWWAAGGEAAGLARPELEPLAQQATQLVLRRVRIIDIVRAVGETHVGELAVQDLLGIGEDGGVAAQHTMLAADPEVARVADRLSR